MNSVLRITAVDVRPSRFRSLCVWVCFVLTVLVPASQRSVSAFRSDASIARAQSDATSIPLQAPPPSIFRLGDGGKPFGWSTVVGDFNTDGKPDIAVADHIPRR